MYLSRNAVIQCSHGGRLVPDRRCYVQIGNQKVLTRQAILDGRIERCPSNCERVTELITGAESEALNAPLLTNLEFLTDSDPPGREVVLAEPVMRRGSHTHAILLTSAVWLLLAVAAVVVTGQYYENQYYEDYNQLNGKIRECTQGLETLRREVERSR